jgi:hypothetical protein
MATPRWLAAAAVISCLASAPAGAACVGVSTFATCTDGAGNQYTVTRSGTMPTFPESDPSTGGNSWNETPVAEPNVTTGSQTNPTANSSTGNQQSGTGNRSGNTTTHQGRTNGQPWNTNGPYFGGTNNYNGMNTHAQPYSYTGSYTGTQFGGRR